uniref:RecQ-mediated genome instability protein 1 n=1 Tax=Maylandia zebra TaxID=106582 RepID=A0A3P9DLG5_9CICH
LAVVRATQAWLQSSWHVQVPFAWLEACVEWLQGEAGGEAHLSQQQTNQQALDQWLLTDLRDLDFPVLPEGLAEAQKTELSGNFCVQVDSLLDISQPAYGQLQKWRGTDCVNDEVSAVTQTTQRPWEAKPTRMLLLQVTDGVQSLEAMEYQPIPALSAALRPGAKLQLQGKIVCRLGVLLLGPSNIKILGGEVEDLVDRNNQVTSNDFSYVLSELSTRSDRGGSTRSSRNGLDQGYLNDDEHVEADLFDSVPPDAVHQQIQDHSMADEDFPDEDFNDLPLEELDSVIFQENESVPTPSDSSYRNTPRNSRITGNPNRATKPQIPVQLRSSRGTESTSYETEASRSSKQNARSGSPVPPVTLTSPPFTYLCLLENLMSKPLLHIMEIHVKAFIVTLLGKLSSSNGVWSVSATISDGTGYLDVELSNEVLTGLLGFSVAEKGALKRDPSRRGELDAGMRRCQEELVDMCCIMTVIVQLEGRKAVVTKVDPVSEKTLQELEQRVRDGRK